MAQLSVRRKVSSRFDPEQILVVLRSEIASTWPLAPDIVSCQLLARPDVLRRHNTGIGERNGCRLLWNDSLAPTSSLKYLSAHADQIAQIIGIHRNLNVRPHPISVTSEMPFQNSSTQGNRTNAGSDGERMITKPQQRVGECCLQVLKGAEPDKLKWRRVYARTLEERERNTCFPKNGH